MAALINAMKAFTFSAMINPSTVAMPTPRQIIGRTIGGAGFDVDTLAGSVSTVSEAIVAVSADSGSEVSGSDGAGCDVSGWDVAGWDTVGAVSPGVSCENSFPVVTVARKIKASPQNLMV